MFCSKQVLEKSSKSKKKGLRLVYSEPHMSPGKLVNRDQGISVNCKHGNTFLSEIYKTFSKSLIYEIGGRRYNLRTEHQTSYP